MTNLHIDYKLWIFADDLPGVFGDGKVRLLTEIAKQGSLREAARTLDISYRKAWGDLRKAEACLGIALLDRQRGGAGGGGRCVLTPKALMIIDRYRDMRGAIDAKVATEFRAFITIIRK